jgi:MOSC domain-containing protein YiiM
LYIAAEAAQPMERVDRVVAVAGRGLAGDRYFLERGHWSGTDGCEVTIIAQEDIDEIERRSSVQVQNGQHRRNIVTRNLPVEILAGKRFRIGSASFGYERPRPPCAYIQMVSEPGMTRALGKRAGICVRCIRGGEILEGDQIVILSVTPLQALRYRAKAILERWQSKNRGHR